MGCEDFLEDLRRRIKDLKFSLNLEKKSLNKARDTLTEEREKLMAENSSQKNKIHRIEILTKQKEGQLEALKQRYEEMMQKIHTYEESNANMEREIKSLQKRLEDEKRIYSTKKSNLESSLDEVSKKMNGIILSNKWLKTTNENELRLFEADWENKFMEETQLMREEFDRQTERYEEAYWDLLRNSVYPKQELVKMLKENLAMLTLECDEQILKNKELEQEIKLLKSFV